MCREVRDTIGYYFLLASAGGSHISPACSLSSCSGVSRWETLLCLCSACGALLQIAAGWLFAGRAGGAARSTRQGVARPELREGEQGALFMRARKLCARLDRDERKRSGERGKGEGGRERER